ncbi:cobalt ECF transporter T component CbiQ [Maridesulfovibrio salexigens]|uniref:Cobalt ABC transporter, inner membrane subunit CbiQ n=1 Tax=Maridesulfovibrio salexigens (strain ATCC 14822 / DSM 2638 / NCIMB 8403 / VKM B-1763) TaxID=526222 RepID=C6C257_MARSD|nr:cobalt ECF transporter T component CbiQ [Maridesulfovibrio salexigens]ACS81258.1 cobalt ABC transporter, inner membrane subunit CbiQ [Maridesulfovibrio salexigens DSM 2638]
MQQLTEPFAYGNSIIHSMHPGFRLACAFLFSLAGALVTNLAAATSVLAAGIIFAIAARLSLSNLLKRLLIVNFFILFLWIFLPFSRSGEPLFNIGPLTATLEGIIYTAIITLKSNGVILAMTALISTMEVQTLGAAMQSLKLPDKLCRLLLFSWRYVHVMSMEYNRMRRAAAMRAFSPRTDFRTYRTYAWLMGMLLVRSMDRAHRVWQAMLCRGFDGTFHTLTTFSTGKRDIALLLATLGCITTFIFLEFNKIEVLL